MDIDQALAFLSERQPMPSDHVISDWECDRFCELLSWFEQNPDPRCLPPHIHCVSKETGLGMYEDISHVLQAHLRGDVLHYLSEGLKTGTDGMIYRCCNWATDLDAWELVNQIAPLEHHQDADIREAAAAYLQSLTKHE